MKVQAKDTVIGQTYKSLLMDWEICIKDKHYVDKVITSVDVIVTSLDKDKVVSIPPTTLLYSMDTDEKEVISDNKVEDSRTNQNTELITNKQSQGDVMNNKDPRSLIIDRELLKVKEGAKPDWDGIATVVIKAGKATEKDRAKVKFQARSRHRWYTKLGKKNPAADGNGAKKATTAAPKKKAAPKKAAAPKVAKSAPKPPASVPADQPPTPANT